MKLSDLKAQEEVQLARLKALGESHLKYEEDEAKYWEDLLYFEKTLHNLLEKKVYAERTMGSLQKELEKLEKSNVLNDVFRISAEYEVGTINDMKIGKLYNASDV